MIDQHAEDRDEMQRLAQRCAKLETALRQIKAIMDGPAANRRFMQIAEPARRTLNIIRPLLGETEPRIIQLKR